MEQQYQFRELQASDKVRIKEILKENKQPFFEEYFDDVLNDMKQKQLSVYYMVASNKDEVIAVGNFFYESKITRNGVSSVHIGEIYSSLSLSQFQKNELKLIMVDKLTKKSEEMGKNLICPVYKSTVHTELGQEIFYKKIGYTAGERNMQKFNNAQIASHL